MSALDARPTRLFAVVEVAEGWCARLASALALASELAAPDARVDVLFLGDWADETVASPALLRGLGAAFECLPSPTLDVVPLLNCCGYARYPAGATVAAARASGARVVGFEPTAAETSLVGALPGLPVAAGPATDAPRLAAARLADDGGGDSAAMAFKSAAVGGTFDRLHAGHRLLLAATACVCEETVYVGVAGDALLAKKAHAEKLWPFERRSETAKAYLEACRPGIAVSLSALLDPKAPPKAATMSEITALVISRETVAGADKLAAMRADNGIAEPLRFVVVDLVGAESTEPAAPKLSSSALREADST